MDLVRLQECWHRVSSAGHHTVCVCVCGAQDPAFEVVWSSCKSKAASPMRVPDQWFQGVTDEPENIHNHIMPHGDGPCLQE